MKLQAKNIATLIVIVIAFYIWQVYNAAKTLSFALGKITGVRAVSGTIEFMLYLRVTNGDMTGVPLTGVNIDNVLGDTVIGKAILEESTFISGRATTDIPLRIIIPFTDLLLLIPEIKRIASSKKVVFALRGNVSAVGITVPLQQTYILDLGSIF